MSISSAMHGFANVMYSNFCVTLPIPPENSSLSQQTFIVTGANTGLGLESSRHLVRLGAGKLIMAVRNDTKGNNARKALLAANPDAKTSIEVWSIDMDSYDSIKAFATRASSLPRIDGVLANAGMATQTFTESEGLEKSLNINVVSTFLLYALMLPKMTESGRSTGNPCRFTIPNSALHYMSPIAELKPKNQTIMERLNDPKQANMTARYMLTKLLVVYATREFAERARAAGNDSVIINTPNPSFCKSDLMNESMSPVGRVFERVVARTGEEGSRTLVHGLLAGPESHGQYLANCHVQKPSNEVTGKWGQKTQKAFVQELLDRYDTIQPGISATI